MIVPAVVEEHFVTILFTELRPPGGPRRHPAERTVRRRVTLASYGDLPRRRRARAAPALPIRQDLAIGTSFLTVMFAELAAGGDDDAARRAHFAALRTAIAAHEGREIKSSGDGLMVTFAKRRRGGALRGRHAARRARRPGAPCRSASTPASRAPRGTTSTAAPVIVASRLCDLAAAGEILVSDVVRQIAVRAHGGADPPAGFDAPARNPAPGGGRGGGMGGRAEPPITMARPGPGTRSPS